MVCILDNGTQLQKGDVWAGRDDHLDNDLRTHRSYIYIGYVLRDRSPSVAQHSSYSDRVPVGRRSLKVPRKRNTQTRLWDAWHLWRADNQDKFQSFHTFYSLRPTKDHTHMR